MNLTPLTAFYNWMKERRVTHAKYGTMELTVTSWDPEPEVTRARSKDDDEQSEDLHDEPNYNRDDDDPYNDPMLYPDGVVPRLPVVTRPSG